MLSPFFPQSILNTHLLLIMFSLPGESEALYVKKGGDSILTLRNSKSKWIRRSTWVMAWYAALPNKPKTRNLSSSSQGFLSTHKSALIQTCRYGLVNPEAVLKSLPIHVCFSCNCAWKIRQCRQLGRALSHSLRKFKFWEVKYMFRAMHLEHSWAAQHDTSTISAAQFVGGVLWFKMVYSNLIYGLNGLNS